MTKYLKNQWETETSGNDWSPRDSILYCFYLVEFVTQGESGFISDLQRLEGTRCSQSHHWFLCIQSRSLILFTLIELFDGVQELVFVVCVNLVFLRLFVVSLWLSDHACDFVLDLVGRNCLLFLQVIHLFVNCFWFLRSRSPCWTDSKNYSSCLIQGFSSSSLSIIFVIVFFSSANRLSLYFLFWLTGLFATSLLFLCHFAMSYVTWLTVTIQQLVTHSSFVCSVTRAASYDKCCLYLAVATFSSSLISFSSLVVVITPVSILKRLLSMLKLPCEKSNAR